MSKALSLNEIRSRCSKFVSDWAEEPGEERQQAQSFIRDLLAAFGMSKTKAALYEYRARKSDTGDRGYIDGLVPGQCLIEMKSAGRDLVAAEQQAINYMDGLTELERPHTILTSDFKRFRILSLGSGEPTVEEFPLEELPKRADALAFLAGYRTREFGSREQEAASIAAAQLMAQLYETLEGSGYDDHEASIFLVRTLFCLYADDSGIWERDLFWEWIDTRTNEDGSDLGPQLTMLFQALAKAPSKRQRNIDEVMARFPYTNGGIFAEPLSIPAFDRAMRDLLLKACSFDWSGISPAIFGSLFQAVKDKKARRSLGEHYTTETNILKTIEPLFLDELRERFTQVQHDVPGLRKLRRHVGDLRFMDPACGCGNFLVVAYREMRALDLQILERIQALTAGQNDTSSTLFFDEDDLPVTLDHFAGIEIEEWPARIAETALHLVHHQANQAMELALGAAPDPLPLDTIETIHTGNALRLDWTSVLTPSPNTYIFGNPPFLGHATRSPEQAQELRDVWQRKDIGRLDYVTAWYRKSLDYFARTRGGRFAFVSTNSITQGEPVPALFGPVFEAGWRIRFAHRTFAWSSEAPGAAAVHCVVVGFDHHEKTPAQLYSYETVKDLPTAAPAKRINAYLIDADNVLVDQRRSVLAPDLTPAVFGNMARDGGHLIVEPEAYDDVKADPVASKYLRRFIQAKELIHDAPRWCFWLVDLDPADATKSPILRERLEAVRQMRASSKAPSTQQMAQTPHLFGQRSQPDVDYVCIPRHFSETRAFPTVASFPPDVICGDANFKAEDPDGFLFGILSSSMFLAWQRAIGGRIKSDLRFSNTLVWNNLPLQKVDEKTRSGVIAAGKDVLAARALHPERSLAEHYNPLAMDPALLKAHAGLDRVVDKAFGARKRLTTDEERQRILFASYEKMTSTD